MDFLEDKKEKVISTMSNAAMRVPYEVTKKTIKPDAKPVDASMRSKLMFSALSGLMSLATTSALSKTLLKTKAAPSLLVAQGLAGAASGFFAPDIVNIITKEKQGKISHEDAMKSINEMGSTINSATIPQYLSKEAAVFKVLKSIGKHTGKAAAVPIGLAGRGVGATARKFPKLTAVATVGGLGYGAHRVLKRPNTFKPNYTTHVRNNVLAGNISSSSLSQRDLKDVRKLGL